VAPWCGAQAVLRGHHAERPALFAIVAAAAGQREEALALAKRAWDERDPFLHLPRHYPGYQWFREQPTFAEILRQMDAPGRAHD